MKYKYFTLILGLLLISSTVSALGIWEKKPKNVQVEKNMVVIDTETETATPDIPLVSESDDLFIFMEELTGHRNIIQVNGEINIGKLRDLLRLAYSGETDASGRRYFAYSVPVLRQDPVSMSYRRLDIESFLAKAARELGHVYKVDVEFNIRRENSEETGSFVFPAVLELTSEIILIGRKEEVIITYVVDNGNDDYGYGIFYILSAIPMENRNSDFQQIMAGLNGNDRSVVSAILEKMASDDSGE